MNSEGIIVVMLMNGMARVVCPDFRIILLDVACAASMCSSMKRTIFGTGNCLGTLCETDLCGVSGALQWIW